VRSLHAQARTAAGLKESGRRGSAGQKREKSGGGVEGYRGGSTETSKKRRRFTPGVPTEQDSQKIRKKLKRGHNIRRKMGRETAKGGGQNRKGAPGALTLTCHIAKKERAGKTSQNRSANLSQKQRTGVVIIKEEKNCS